MNIIKIVSDYAVPVTILLILVIGLYRNVKVYDIFVEGAKDSITTVIRIIPSLVGLFVAIGVFRASGAMDLLVFAVRPIANLLNIPSEALPLALLRPVSGSASLALVSDILKTHGPDSYIGRVVSTMMGSTETIFYTLTIYCGAVGIKNIRYTLLAALIADGVGIITSVWICTLIFGS
ncbi:MAG: spore maturation protein [Clostridiaceae bacterium]|jgi:spore maturation protein B|nr:spore maturation protein [Clostridiaceae bacterium]